MSDKTKQFPAASPTDEYIEKILNEVITALEEKGYDAINQISGYILTEDPTYITTHNDARNKIRKLDRFEIVKLLFKYFTKDVPNS